MANDISGQDRLSISARAAKLVLAARTVQSRRISLSFNKRKSMVRKPNEDTVKHDARVPSQTTHLGKKRKHVANGRRYSQAS